MKFLNKDINKSVFYYSISIIFFVALSAFIFPEYLSELSKSLQTWLSNIAGWIYILSVGVILLLSLWLICSRFGDVKLGPDHSEPEFKNLSWFSMLFSAGMGIGLIFWGVAEPIIHFTTPPIGEPLTIESAKAAMTITFFHWGIHVWAIYGLFAVTLAYFCYRKDLPLLPRSAFYPLIGNKIYGVVGDILDTFAILGTIFGVGTSLGIGVMQLNAGLNYLFGLPQTITIQIILIACITSLSTFSVVCGLEKGIKKLSNINMILACILMGSVLMLGNTIDLLQSFVQNIGNYFSSIVGKTFNLYAYEDQESWVGGWTLLYWGWWISWAPFVSMFIARISKGRTIREFMIGVLFIPTGFTFLWMTVLGNSAISLIFQGEAQELVNAATHNTPIALFKFFEHFPFPSILSFLGLILIITFFVSSSDSGSFVIDTLVSRGKDNPYIRHRVFWSLTEGVLAAALLVAGGLNTLQTMTIVSSLPILAMILCGAYALLKSLQEDRLLHASVQYHNTIIQYSKASSGWKERLDSLSSYPQHKEAYLFLEEIVNPALRELRNEMIDKGLDAEIKKKEGESATLTVRKQDAEDFLYEIQLRSFSVPDHASVQDETFYRAEVFLSNGGQDYNIFGYTAPQVIADALTQYEKHFHFLHNSSY